MSDRNRESFTSPSEEHSQADRDTILDEGLQALAHRLRSLDYSQHSQIRESLRQRIAWQVDRQAALPVQPLPRLNLAAAMTTIFLVFFLAFTWRETTLTGRLEQPARPATANPSTFAYADLNLAASRTTTTLTQVKSQHVQATPGVTVTTGGYQVGPQPALAPVPKPPSQ